jgi:uncharacterized protein YegP (UPF0339 family)
MRFELYKDHAAEWRWRLRSQNGNVIADSAESYRHREDCENGIRLVKETANAPVVDMSAKVASDSQQGA